MIKPLPETVIAYLSRLGVEPEPPSAGALARLHRAHVERIPYETLWIHLDEGWTIDPADSMSRIAHQGRGGYCFHLNGAFSKLLSALGYCVSQHVGAVHGPDGPSEGELANHLVLTVHDLPTDDHPGGNWYVDTGLGDALHEPIPLRPITHAQGPFRYTLVDSPDGLADWHFTHDPTAGSFTGMVWRSAPAGMDAFARQHHRLSTSPDSRFRQVMTVQRRDVTGVDVLRGRVLRRIGANPGESVLATRTEMIDVLGDTFGLDTATIETGSLDALWDRIVRAHETWLALLETSQ